MIGITISTEVIYTALIKVNKFLTSALVDLTNLPTLEEITVVFSYTTITSTLDVLEEQLEELLLPTQAVGIAESYYPEG